MLCDSGVSATVDVFDANAATWSTHAMSTPRHDFGMVADDNLIFIGGGWNDSTAVGTTDLVDVFDTRTKEWSVMHLSVSRGSLSAASVEDVVMFAGGQSGESNTIYHDRIDIYNLTSNTWATAKLSLARADMSAVGIRLSRKILFAGGDYNSAGNLTNLVDLYNYYDNSWHITYLSVARNYMAACHIVKATRGGIEYAMFAGGSAADGPSDIVDIFDGIGWRTQKLSVARTYLAAAVDRINYKAYFAGGVDSSGNDVDIVDVYNTVIHGWESVQHLSVARHALTGLSCPTFGKFCQSGKVFFAGGEMKNKNTTILYDTVDIL